MNPYLSIIIAARNDTHGGDFIRRLLLSLRTLYMLNKKYPIDLELIIVEWNPPKDRLSLHELLPPPPSDLPIQLRIIQVPSELHKSYKTHQQLKMYQMIAKNVGIRRANGQFILCTNADIIYSEPLFGFLSQKKLKKDHFYRCNRCDIDPPPEDLQEQATLNEILRFCRQHVQQRLGKNRWYANFPGSSPFWYKYLPMQILTIILSRLLHLFIAPSYNLYHSLDTWACGDFTLMHKDDWYEIQGYAELDAYSLHIDSLALGAATALGKKQIILPLSHCTYHISHKDGWEMQDPLEKILFDLRMPKLDNSTLQELLLQMIQKRTPTLFNTNNWGHTNQQFSTFTLKKRTNYSDPPKNFSKQATTCG